MSNWQPARGARSHRPRSLLARLLRTAALLFLSWTLLETLFISLTISRATSGPPPPPLHQHKIFIASINWNNEQVLREAWIPAVVALAQEIGRENVFVSILESGSWDDTKGALRDLDGLLAQAGIRRRIVLDDTTHADEIAREPGLQGWVRTPRGRMELRRIPYLAGLRNRAMDPLYELEGQGVRFDKVLWLNDVVFDSADVRRLVGTRGGEYAAACSMDYAKKSEFYDTFALRDMEGQNKIMKQWPYFRALASRAAMRRSEPVPVQSCWNGIVALDATPFYSTAKERGLTFRGLPDGLAEYHLEGSECCLIHADNPYAWKGVWLNPNVRVGYSKAVYDYVQHAWGGFFSIAYGTWVNRILRWTTSPYFADQIVKDRLAEWEMTSAANMEPGKFCIVNEMQVLVSNGWAHV